MNNQPKDDNLGRDIPLSESEITSLSQDPYRYIKTHRPLGKTSLLVVLVVFHVACNVAIIVASLHTFRLGAQIIADFLPVDDNRALTVINTAAKVLSITSATIGGWAASHLWSRRLSKPGSSAGLAELQSLTIFESAPTIYHSIRHLIAGRYISANWLYCGVIAGAVLLQVYSIAVSALITPALTEMRQSRQEEITSGLYLTRSIDCDPGASACLDIALSSRAISDAVGFTRKPVRWVNDDSTPWLEADSTFYIPGLVVQAAFPVGPINGEDFSEGGVLWGLNLDAVLSVTSVPDKFLLPPRRSPWDAIWFLITFSAQIPSLQCVCGFGSNSATHVTIDDNQYVLASPIVFDVENDGEIAGRMTVDNNTLIVAFSSTLPSNNNISITYCAIQLRFQEMPLSMRGIPSTVADVDDTLIVSPSPLDAPPFNSLIPRNTSVSPVSLSPFALPWLHGLGWDDQPVPSPIVDLLQRYDIGTGSDNGGLSSTKPFLECFVLVMLANGISSSFSKLLSIDGMQLPSPDNARNTSIQFDIMKRQYFIGAKTAFQRFFLFVIFLDSAFALFCLLVILRDGWYPDLSNPVRLTQVALSSSPPGMPKGSDLHADPNNIGGLAQSPVPLQHGPDETANPLLWKEKFSLVESSEGGFLMFRTQTPKGDIEK